MSPKSENINNRQKIGVLGGGQLGRMLIQEATKLDLDLWFMDRDFDYPVPAIYPQFVQGDFTNYDDVIAFGSVMDIITIEIENVNTEALRALEKLGKKVYPQARVIETIKDKGLQKQFYQEHSIPTSEFFLVENKQQILLKLEEGILNYPFIQKSRTEGYDGKGVVAIRSEEDLIQLLDGPAVIEKMVDIEKELAVIVARNSDGGIVDFPLTEMVFDPKGNLLDYLVCPAQVDSKITTACQKMARELIQKFDMIGLLAVEIFLDKSGQLLINEVAPRPHNSGHHTIDAGNYSQYNIHLRTLLNWPLLPVVQSECAIMINLLGSLDQTGEADYEGLSEILKLENVFPHIYGKKITKPLRKMGHINLIGSNVEELLTKMKQIKSTVKFVACQK